MKQRLAALAGIRKHVLLFLLGAVMTLAIPPLGIFPVLFACVPAFIFLSQKSRTCFSAFLSGWSFGAGYFILGLYWVSAALFVDINLWKWVLPLSLILGPAVIALYWGFIPLVARRFRDHDIAHSLVFIAAWAAIEWLRGHLFTGFPWNLPGYAWQHVLPVMQVSSVTGVYGLTLLTLFIAGFSLYDRKIKFAVGGLLGILLVFGGMRMYLHPTMQNADNTVRIVQANIPQTMKWDPDQDWRNLEKHALLSDAKKPATYVVWPETAVTSDLVIFPDIAQYIRLKIPENSTAILGSLRVTYDAAGKEQYHNSVSAMDRKGKVIDTYHKFHLVPFGEYIPFRDKLNLTPIALAISNIGDFTAGTGNRTIRVEGKPSFSPLICYEVIFPHAAIDQNDRPDLMVNVTNDGWYGRTAGPHQHLDIARMRAIEEGLPLARAANTGISAVIDPVGRIIALQPLETSGVVDSIIPAPLPQTVYGAFGDLIFGALVLLMLAMAGVIYVRRR